MVIPGDPSENQWKEFPDEIQSEVEQTRRSLKEVTLLLEQSQAELAKLTQRNAAINGHLQQVQTQFDSVPRADIRSAYAAALDVQQRLLVMRGQLEKLQSDQTNYKRALQILERVHAFLEDEFGQIGQGRARGSAAATLEMVINAQEAVRQRLSTQIHNGPAQALTNFILQLDIATRTFDIDSNRAKEELTNLRSSAMSTFQQVKGFISELRPMMLDDLGLMPTLDKYVKDFKDSSNCDINLTLKGQQRRLESYLEVMIFRAVQELITNATKHNADHPVRVQVNVMVILDDAIVKVVVSDNGKGFDPQTALRPDSIGLKLIRERVEILGGIFEVDSAIGKGAKISFQVPAIEPGLV